MGGDAKSSQKRDESVTVVNDLEGSRVLYVGDERRRAPLDDFYGRCSVTAGINSKIQ